MKELKDVRERNEKKQVLEGLLTSCGWKKDRFEHYVKVSATA